MDEDEAHHLVKVGNEWHHLGHNLRNTGYEKRTGNGRFVTSNKKYYLCSPTFCLGGGMVDTRDLDLFFERIICKRQ